MTENPLDMFIQGFAQFFGVFTENCVATFDALPEKVLFALFGFLWWLTMREGSQDCSHYRWERCYCAPVFKSAPVYPRYLYEEIHGLTDYDDLYPRQVSDLERSIKALANAFRSGAITLGDAQPRRMPEFFINH